jgi:hypothetical protein
MSETPLTAAQDAAVARWWSEQTPKVLAAAWRAAGFTTIYSMIGWDELKRTMPDVAAALGRSIISRYGLRA